MLHSTSSIHRSLAPQNRGNFTFEGWFVLFFSTGDGPPGSGDHPPSIPTQSHAAAVAAAQAAAAAAIQGSSQQAGAGKDGPKSVMENISMWGVPQKDRSKSQLFEMIV